jgi:hypothetical protein
MLNLRHSHNNKLKHKQNKNSVTSNRKENNQNPEQYKSEMEDGKRESTHTNTNVGAIIRLRIMWILGLPNPISVP